jgi:hypothetical protein
MADDNVVKKEIVFNGVRQIGSFIVVDMDARSNSLHMFDFEYLDEAVSVYSKMKEGKGNPRIYRAFTVTQGVQ